MCSSSATLLNQFISCHRSRQIFQVLPGESTLWQKVANMTNTPTTRARAYLPIFFFPFNLHLYESIWKNTPILHILLPDSVRGSGLNYERTYHKRTSVPTTLFFIPFVCICTSILCSLKEYPYITRFVYHIFLSLL